MSVEQMVRDILEQAAKDGLVAIIDNRDPQSLTSGELVGTANRLNSLMSR